MIALNDYLIIEEIKENNSRIVISEDKKPQRGKVVDGAKLMGKTVIFKKWSGIEYGKYLFVKFEDILAEE